MKLTIEEAKSYGWGDRAQAFMDWRNAMDDLVIQDTGLGLDDFPDWDFAMAFDEGMTPKVAAVKFLDDQMKEFWGFNWS